MHLRELLAGRKRMTPPELASVSDGLPLPRVLELSDEHRPQELEVSAEEWPTRARPLARGRLGIGWFFHLAISLVVSGAALALVVRAADRLAIMTDRQIGAYVIAPGVLLIVLWLIFLADSYRDAARAYRHLQFLALTAWMRESELRDGLKSQNEWVSRIRRGDVSLLEAYEELERGQKRELRASGSSDVPNALSTTGT